MTERLRRRRVAVYSYKSRNDAARLSGSALSYSWCPALRGNLPIPAAWWSRPADWGTYRSSRSPSLKRSPRHLASLIFSAVQLFRYKASLTFWEGAGNVSYSHVFAFNLKATPAATLIGDEKNRLKSTGQNLWIYIYIYSYLLLSWLGLFNLFSFQLVWLLQPLYINLSIWNPNRENQGLFSHGTFGKTVNKCNYQNVKFTFHCVHR